MNFFRKGIEYNNLAKTFNGLGQMIYKLESKIKNENSDSTEEILLLAYLGRKDVLDKIDEFKWNLNTPIVVPLMGKVTLGMAFQMTIGKLMQIAEEVGIGDDLNEVLDKGDLFFELDKSIPNHLKSLMQ